MCNCLKSKSAEYIKSLGQNADQCHYCKGYFCWKHSHFSVYNQDSTIENMCGKKICCNQKFCVLRFEHEAKIKEQCILAQLSTNPRPFLEANATNYANTWLSWNNKLKWSIYGQSGIDFGSYIG